MPTNGEALEGDPVALLAPEVFSGDESLPAERCLEIHRLMVRTRAMEERMIKMSKSGQGYFWIGGPGEEAFNACLGLQVKKGHGPAYDYPPPPLPQQRDARGHGHAAAGRHPPDGHDRHRHALDGPQLRRPLLPPRMERHAGHVGDRGAVRHGAGHGPGAEAPRRRRHHHRHRRRRGHGRGRFRLVPGLEHAAGQRIASAHHRDEQRMGHLDAGGQPARREAHHRPRQGVRHSRREWWTATTRSPAGTPSAGPWPTAAASAAPSCWRRWSPGCTAIRRRAAPCASRTSRTALALFEQKLLDAGVLDHSDRSSRSTKTPSPRRRRRWNRRWESRSRRPADVMKHTYAPSTVDAVYPEDYTGLPESSESEA